MFALHARYSRLQWSDLLNPAVRFAREGHAVSRAFAAELAVVADALFADPSARAVFAQADGRPLDEGQVLRQVELAAFLDILRRRGPGDFYDGVLARQFAEASREAGGTLNIGDLRAYAPRFLPPIAVPLGANVAVFTPPPSAGGATAAQLVRVLTRHLPYAGARAAERAHLFVEASARLRRELNRQLAGTGALPEGDWVADDRLQSLVAPIDGGDHEPLAAEDPGFAGRTEQPSAASLVAVDRFGQAVACGFTLNYPFGTGRIAPGTGILLAAAPGIGGRDAADLGAMMVVNENTGAVFYGAAASGGSAASSALASVGLATMEDGAPLGGAMAVQRVHHAGWPDIVLYEPGLGPELPTALQARGHQARPAQVLGRVNAFHCPGGLPRQTACSFVTDPRGHGLALSAD